MKTEQPIIGPVVITGASSGIGETCALYLDKLGFRVFAGVRRQEDADKLKANASNRLTPIILDVTDAESIKAAAQTVDKATAQTGIIGLINNAGIGGGGPLEFLALDKIRSTFEVNVFGTIAVTQAFLPHLRKRKGRIINISSIAGLVTTPFTGSYSASKFALESFSNALRLELAPWNMKVSVVEPGSIATPMWNKGEEIREQLLVDLPAEAIELYGTMFENHKKIFAKASEGAESPQAVVDVILEALTSPQPQTRYLVGKDAKLMATVGKRLSDQRRDQVISKLFGLQSVEQSSSSSSLPKLLLGLATVITILTFLLGRKRES